MSEDADEKTVQINDCGITNVLWTLAFRVIPPGLLTFRYWQDHRREGEWACLQQPWKVDKWGKLKDIVPQIWDLPSLYLRYLNSRMDFVEWGRGESYCHGDARIVTRVIIIIWQVVKRGDQALWSFKSN